MHLYYIYCYIELQKPKVCGVVYRFYRSFPYMARKAASHTQQYKRAGNYSSSFANRAIENKCFKLTIIHFPFGQYEQFYLTARE